MTELSLKIRVRARTTNILHGFTPPKALFISFYPFAYKDKANEAWNRVQQLYFRQKVMRRTDFRQVDDDLAKTIGSRKVFENVGLRNRVIARRDSLRNVEIADYHAQASRHIVIKTWLHLPKYSDFP